MIRHIYQQSKLCLNMGLKCYVAFMNQNRYNYNTIWKMIFLCVNISFFKLFECTVNAELLKLCPKLYQSRYNLSDIKVDQDKIHRATILWTINVTTTGRHLHLGLFPIHISSDESPTSSTILILPSVFLYVQEHSG